MIKIKIKTRKLNDAATPASDREEDFGIIIILKQSIHINATFIQELLTIGLPDLNLHGKSCM